MSLGTQGKPQQTEKLTRIDLYQLHRIDPNVPFEESLSELEHLSGQQGKIRHAGVSNFNVRELERVISIGVPQRSA